MKKVLVLLCLGLMLANVECFAQIQFGIKGGVHISALSFNSDHYDIDADKSFCIGPVVKFALPIKRLGIELGALYDYRSSKVQSVGLVGSKSFKSTIEQKQLIVPLNIRYDFNLSKKVGVYVFAGPQLGFVVDRKEVNMDYGVWLPKNFNLSANLGIGTMLFEHLEIALGYNIVCSKSAEVEINGNHIVDEGKFNSLQVNFGYYF